MDPLIFGKNTLSHIVSIQPTDDKLIVYREFDGVVSEEIHPNYYWIIFNRFKYKNLTPLEGDQHFKYMARFESLEHLKAMSLKRLLWSQRAIHTLKV
jgi:hypothetical protein